MASDKPFNKQAGLWLPLNRIISKSDSSEDSEKDKKLVAVDHVLNLRWLEKLNVYLPWVKTKGKLFEVTFSFQKVKS